LEKLDRRMRIAEPDPAQAKRETMEAYAGAKDKENLESLQRQINRYQELVGQPAVKAHAPTLHFARLQLMKMKQTAAALGQAVDAAAMLEEASALYREQPSSAGLAVLVQAAFLRAHEDLKRQYPAYAALAEQTRHSLGPMKLIACTMEREIDLGWNIRQNPFVLQTLEWVKEERKLFPSTADAAEWALLRRVDPALAGSTAERLKADKVDRISYQMQFTLNPAAATLVLEQFWRRELAGDQAAAAAIYREALQAGVPLPPLGP